MPLGDSVWFPDSLRRAGTLAIVVLMVILHHSSLLGLMDAGLLFGWLPVQLAYDILFLLAGVVILYGIALTMPATPAESESGNQTDESTTTEPPTAAER
jgi:hypothetical protein